jgi:hypothetical protein
MSTAAPKKLVDESQEVTGAHVLPDLRICVAHFFFVVGGPKE